jgi:hypothetical protein
LVIALSPLKGLRVFFIEPQPRIAQTPVGASKRAHEPSQLF